jgi:hypothetical protein
MLASGTQAVGFFGRKNPQHAFLDLHHVKEPYNSLWKSQILGYFSPASVPR